MNRTPIHMLVRKASMPVPHLYLHGILRRKYNALSSRRYQSCVTVEAQHTALFLSSASWPEPNATAAGTRTNSLLELFTSSSLFSSVHFGCGADRSPSVNIHSSHYKNVHWHHIKLNREKEMKALLNTIENEYGAIKAVIFDRFYTEEAFSFIIKDACPKALRILDMQDVHSLRIGRQNLAHIFDREYNNESLSVELMEKIMSFDPKDNYQEEMIDMSSSSMASHNKITAKSYDTFLRELASIQRSDLVLVCSSAEMKLLQAWNISNWKMVLAPFFCDIASTNELPSSSDRYDFVTVGGFKHSPNIDSVKLLRREIWPRIRHQINNARLHVYGAYPTKEILALNDSKLGFLVHGRIDDLDSELTKRRVLLAPLRYGAGIKGKIVDAWRCGMPVVSTPIGAEGMMYNDSEPWGGAVASNVDDFVEASVSMYTQIATWDNAQKQSIGLLNKLFNKKNNFNLVETAVQNAIAEQKQRRTHDLTSAVLWHQNLRSTRYFSKWVELKETMR